MFRTIWTLAVSRLLLRSVSDEMLRWWIHQVDAPREQLENGEIGMIHTLINRGWIKSERRSSG